MYEYRETKVGRNDVREHAGGLFHSIDLEYGKLGCATRLSQLPTLRVDLKRSAKRLRRLANQSTDPSSFAHLCCQPVSIFKRCWFIDVTPSSSIYHAGRGDCTYIILGNPFDALLLDFTCSSPVGSFFLPFSTLFISYRLVDPQTRHIPGSGSSSTLFGVKSGALWYFLYVRGHSGGGTLPYTLQGVPPRASLASASAHSSDACANGCESMGRAPGKNLHTSEASFFRSPAKK